MKKLIKLITKNLFILIERKINSKNWKLFNSNLESRLHAKKFAILVINKIDFFFLSQIIII